MKKISIILFLTVFVISSCKKEPDAVSKIVTVSYPTINLIGPAYIHISVGTPYTDQGATLIDDITGASSSISAVSNEVNVNVPGLYAVTYSAANSNGFKTTATRTVLVLDYTPPAGLDPNYDISGLYQRTNGIFVNLIKMDNGLYIIDNFAGSSLVYPAYLLTPDTTSIDIPAQTTFGGFPIDVTGETFSSGPPITFAYHVMADGFGTGLRTFIHQ